MKPSHLANAELTVMKLLWKEDRLTARHIREQLYPDATKAQHGTVQRLLQRLEDKGYVEEVLYTGTLHAQEVAEETLQLMKKAMGLTGVWNRISRRARDRMKKSAQA